MTARRRSAWVMVVATLVLLAGASLLPTDARAVTGDEFTIPALKTIEVDEPIIPGNDPASSQGAAVVGSPTPDQCALSPACMTVPFNVEVPKKKAGDDFVVYLTFSWEQPTGAEDIDFWIFDDGQTAKAEGSSGYTEIGSSASGDMPEKVKLYDPEFGRYNIVANNFSGANTGWHIKAESTVGVFEKPFESLAPGPGGGSVNPGNKPTTTTVPRPATTIATASTVTVPEGQVIPDDDFEGGAFAPEQGNFDEQLAAGQQAESALRSLGKGKASSPSALTVVAWLLVLPAVLAGAGVVGVRLRRRSARLRRRAATP